jgi:hypothetical protein
MVSVGCSNPTEDTSSSVLGPQLPSDVFQLNGFEGNNNNTSMFSVWRLGVQSKKKKQSKTPWLDQQSGASASAHLNKNTLLLFFWTGNA